MAKILILGGSGFLSGTLAAMAIEEGHDVWVVTRGTRPVPEGLHSIKADRKDRKGFKNTLEATGVKWDLAVDCIAYEADDLKQDLDCLEARANHLVYISTDFVYDPNHRHFPQLESPAVYNTEGYGGGKRAGEKVLEEYGEGPLKWTIFRPGHIYGPGSKLGCLPLHGRDDQLIERIKRGEAISLVGGGHLLQQPVYAPDLARLILSVPGKVNAIGRIFNAAGPEAVESWRYYEYIGEALGKSITIKEISQDEYRRENPDKSNFCSHRLYSQEKLKQAGLEVPSTPLKEGLAAQVKHILEARDD